MPTLAQEKKALLENNLKRTADLLRQGQFLTVAQIAAILDCSKVAAYAWVRELQDRGVSFQKRRAQDSALGPKPTAYAIVD